MDDLRNLLDQVQAGVVSAEAAWKQLTAAAVAELGYASVDLHRRQRCGFPEVIFCEGKPCEWLAGLVGQLVEAKQDCLATRVNAEQADFLARQFPQAQQDRLARTFWLPAGPPPPPRGRVLILTAGTSDLPVGQEAAVTARALGTDA